MTDRSARLRSIFRRGKMQQSYGACRTLLPARTSPRARARAVACEAGRAASPRRCPWRRRPLPLGRLGCLEASTPINRARALVHPVLEASGAAITGSKDTRNERMLLPVPIFRKKLASIQLLH